MSQKGTSNQRTSVNPWQLLLGPQGGRCPRVKIEQENKSLLGL